ncbi:hypothetical protein A2U01_0110138, partial [Trifolium medium]|nr:hypothetical protein [Trifolium medium]
MLMDPLPKIAKVYSLLVQPERQIPLSIDEFKVLAVSGVQSNSAGRGYA